MLFRSGFSFRYDAPLDMRMNKLAKVSAADIINNYSKEDLMRIFRIYGELDKPHKAAEFICKERENNLIETTAQLSKCVERLYNTTTEHKFLAKLYQALRIEVNMLKLGPLYRPLTCVHISRRQSNRPQIISYGSR